MLNEVALFTEDAGKLRVCVCETRGKAIQGDYKNRLQPELWVCFHGEVESTFKKWLYPVIKEGGHIGQHSSDDDDDGPPYSLWFIFIAVLG